MPSNSVAVVVPVYKEMSLDEQISFKQLRMHLKNYDTFLMIPDSFGKTFDGLPVKTFPAKYFQGTHTYSELLLSPMFYSAFADYEYILIYQLDCLIFSDLLTEWCRRGYDYIGAPWTVEGQGGLRFDGVGNGGLSLRKVQSCLRVLALRRSFLPSLLRSLKRPFTFLRDLLHWGISGVLSILKGNTSSLLQKSMHAVSKAAKSSKDDYRNEDLFWSFEAPRLDPAFRVPPAEIAVSFAIETQPRFCFEKNSGKLPFGCHNWIRYDRAFWEQYLR